MAEIMGVHGLGLSGDGHLRQSPQRPPCLGPVPTGSGGRDEQGPLGVGAKKHITFGGRLTPDAKGFPASAMAKKNAGDWRDPKRIKDWVAAIDFDLRARALASDRGTTAASGMLAEQARSSFPTADG
jgi:hypothetical protein